MRHSILVGVLVASCALVTLFAPRTASAQVLNSMHPYNCRMVNSSGVEIHGSFLNGQFVNTSGSGAWVVCAVPNINYNSGWYIYASSGVSTCYLAATSTSGGQSMYAPTSHTGNTFYWSRSLTPGTYAMEMQCYLNNNNAIWQMTSN